MTEHLLLYLIHKFKTKEAAEFELIKFLVSLKYFTEKKQERALMFARLIGCIPDPQVEPQGRESRSPSQTSTIMNNQAGPKPSDFYRYDIYQMDFYFYCYSVLMKERLSFHESQEGVTYIDYRQSESITDKVLFFAAPEALSKFMKDTRKAIISFKRDPADEFETEYIDIDLLLCHYME